MFKRSRLNKNILTAIFLLSSICTSFAQTPESDLRQELDEIKQTQQSLKDDLTIIKSLLSRMLNAQPSVPQPTPQQPQQASVKGVEFDIGNNPVLGSESAKLILVEFTDYQCPFCGRYSRETFPQINEQYITDRRNKLHFHFRPPVHHF